MINDTTTAPAQEALEDLDEDSVSPALLSQQFPDLPEDIYGLISSGKLVVDITEIFARQKIEGGAQMPLCSLVFDILLGQMPPENFIPMVLKVIPQQEIGLAFSQEVNRVIFSEVKDGLLFLHRKKGVPAPSSSFGTLKDRVETKLGGAGASPASATQSVVPPSPFASAVPTGTPKPPLAPTPDYREPSALDQKLSSFTMKPSAPTPPTTVVQPPKTSDPYRETT